MPASGSNPPSRAFSVGWRLATASIAIFFTLLLSTPALTNGLGQDKKAKPDQSLDANLKMQNSANSMRQIERLQQRYVQPAGTPPGAAAGGFR
jgi:hypothetical protein